eukprot:134956_1
MTTVEKLPTKQNKHSHTSQPTIVVDNKFSDVSIAVQIIKPTDIDDKKDDKPDELWTANEHTLMEMDCLKRCSICSKLSRWRCSGCTDLSRCDGHVVLCQQPRSCFSDFFLH